MRWLAVAVLFASGAYAQVPADWPLLHDVQNVATDDQLNIRDEPDALSDIVGSLSHDATDIEVVERSGDGKWGRVNTGERSGWVSLQFLTVVTTPGPRPEPFVCFGTEPFWTFTDRSLMGYGFQPMGGDHVGFHRSSEGTSQNLRNRYFLTGFNRLMNMSAVLRAELCSDGMSDRAYGISIDLVLSRFAETQLLSGCCSIAP